MTTRATVTEPKHRKRDLISLVWPENTCYSSLIGGVPRGVKVDFIAGTWTFLDYTLPIGSSRRWGPENVGDPIGVYDRTKFMHLAVLKRDIEWVQTRNGPAIPVG